jgi:hypothetical protein
LTRRSRLGNDLAAGAQQQGMDADEQQSQQAMPGARARWGWARGVLPSLFLAISAGIDPETAAGYFSPFTAREPGRKSRETRAPAARPAAAPGASYR